MAEGQTATNPQTGEKVIFQGGQWVPFGGSQGRYVAPISGPPSRKTELQNAKTEADIADIPMNRAVTQATLADKETAARFKPAEQALKLADNFRQEQPVKDYRAAIGNYGSLLSTAPNPQGDLSLIYSFAKIMDPGSVVREGEMDLAKSTSPVVQQVYQRFQKELSGGGALSDESRRQLRMEAANKMAALNQAYLAARVNYKQFADRYGLNPLDVVGAHEGIRFQDAESKLLGRPITQLDYQGNPVKPAAQPRDPNDPSGAFQGQDIEFNIDKQEGPREGNKFSPDQIRQITAFVGRNPDPTALVGYVDAVSDGKMAITPEAAQTMVKAIKQGNWGGFVYDWQKQQAEELARVKKERDTFTGGVDAVGRGIADIPTLGFADEIAAAGDTIFNGGTYQENLDQQRMIDAADRDVNFWQRTGGQVLGGLALPSRIGSALEVGGVRAAARQGAIEGGTFGGAYGFGSGEDIQSRSLNALLGVTGGATIGAVAPVATNALLESGAAKSVQGAIQRRGEARATQQAERNAVAEAATRQRVQLMPADVGGDGLKALTSAGGQSPFSAGSVRKAAKQGAEDIGDANTRATSQAGNVLPMEQAGEAARKGGQAYIKKVTAQGSRLYDRARKLAEGADKIAPKGALEVIRKEIADIAEAGPMAEGMVSELRKVEASLAQEGGISISGLRRARSILRNVANNDAMRGTDAQRIFKDVMDAAGEDMKAGLVAAGKADAARAFAKADKLWRERIETIDDVLEPIIGKSKSGEDIVKAIEGMARGNRGGVKRLAGMLRSLPEKERGDVTATLIDRMGKAKASAQNEAGDVFSPETFLTNWNQMTPASKSALFADDALRKNLNDIALLASAKRETNALASKSNTPAGILGSSVGMGGGAGVGFMVAGAPGAIVWPVLQGIAQYGMGKLLSSRTFTGWLARAPKNATPKAAEAYVERLSTIAAREPIHSAEIIQLKDFLAKGISESPGRLAAGENENNGRQKPPQ